MIRPPLLLLLLATGAPAPAGDAAKRRACVKAVDNSVGILAAVLAGTAQKLSDDLGTGQTAATKCLKGGGGIQKCAKLDAPDVRKKVDEAVRLCMTWPDALVECLGDFKRLETPACQREWERFQGLVDAQPLGDGPPPRWQAALPERAYDAVAMPDGSIVAQGEKQVFAVRAGKVVWSHPVEARGLVAVPDSGCVLVFEGSRFSCLDATNGRQKWAGVHPDAKAAADPEDTTFLAAASAGNNTVLVDQAGRMFVASPRACADRSPGCLSASGKLSGRFYTTAALWILPSGDRVVTDLTNMFLTDRSGTEYAAMTFRTEGPLTVEETGGLLFVYERTVNRKKCKYEDCKTEVALVRFDPRKCKHKKQKEPLEACDGVLIGKPDDRDDDFESPPIRLPDGDLIVGGTKLVRLGKIRWKADLGMLSAPLLAGDRLYVTARDGAPSKLELRAIDIATGRTLERSWVPGGIAKYQGFLRRVGDLLYVFADKVYAYPFVQTDHSRGLRSP